MIGAKYDQFGSRFKQLKRHSANLGIQRHDEQVKQCKQISLAVKIVI